MDGIFLYAAIGLLTMLAVGGAGFVFVGASGEKSRKRVTAISNSGAKGASLKGSDDTNQQRRKNVQAMLKELEAKQSEHKKRPSLRRRIETAGLKCSVRTFWIVSIFLRPSDRVWRIRIRPESPICCFGSVCGWIWTSAVDA